MLYVNDGSRDGTLTCLQRLRDEDPSVSILHLSRNFGKEVAMTAGIDEARGEAVIVIDADLQDPPAAIEQHYAARAEEGYDIAYARRRTRKGESWLKRFTAAAVYWLMNMVSDVEIPRDTGDFHLMSAVRSTP